MYWGFLKDICPLVLSEMNCQLGHLHKSPCQKALRWHYISNRLYKRNSRHRKAELKGTTPFPRWTHEIQSHVILQKQSRKWAPKYASREARFHRGSEQSLWVKQFGAKSPNSHLLNWCLELAHPTASQFPCMENGDKWTILRAAVEIHWVTLESLLKPSMGYSVLA